MSYTEVFVAVGVLVNNEDPECCSTDCAFLMGEHCELFEMDLDNTEYECLNCGGEVHRVLRCADCVEEEIEFK